MAKPKQITLTEEGVITHEALVAYAAGRLSADETTQIEKLLRDDPFAQDALEGIKTSAAPAEIKSVVTLLNTQLREKTGARVLKKKGIEIHWATYAYAAVIVGILIGLGFVMIHFIADNDQRIAMNKTTPQAQESIPATDEKAQPTPPATDTTHPASALAPTSGSSTMAMDSVVVSGATSAGITSPTIPYSTFSDKNANAGSYYNNQQQYQGFINNNNAPVLADRKAPAPLSPAAAPAAKPAKEAAKAIDDKEKDEVKYSVNGYDIQSGNEVKSQNYKSATAADFNANKTESNQSLKKEKKRAEGASEKASAPPIDNAKAARALFDANDFKEAGKAYNKILSDQPENADALYFGGICDYYNGKGKQAEKNFDKLLKAGLYVDGAKWYKANVLLDHGKKDEGKQLLRDLINTNSSFKDRAVKKYEEAVK